MEVANAWGEFRCVISPETLFPRACSHVLDTKFLAAEIIPPNGENLISEGGNIHFTIDCAGGHRSWDFAHNSLDDSFTFATILKDSLLFTRKPAKSSQSACGFNRKCLIPSLHGRDINACLLIPRIESNANDDSTIINCYTGSEEFCLGSFALEINDDGTSEGPMFLEHSYTQLQ
ncbi:unnamed protein product [Rodentolepis nana]|uniref:Protein MIZU-KUSSEI 1-like n=1 Tax=Rodentolepis nana TaxID=102285 RepID=A0A0R3T1J0_RODNA|nr:unnamed protein product [Rodentolepis nana]